MENKGKFYITTAIAYASRKPHIGNTYDVVSADVIARYKRATGYDVFFCTGTDEHGQKIENYAHDAGVSPQAYVDDISSQIKAICELLGSTHTHFIRTTDDYHVAAVQKIFTKLYEQGDIYKSEYEGWYCVPDETFFTDTQAEGGICPECGFRANMEACEAITENVADETLEPLTEVFTGEAKTIDEVGKYLKVTEEKTCKAVVYQRNADDSYVLIFLRGDKEVNETKLTNYLKAEIHPAVDVENANLAAGNIGPVGLETKATVLFDRSLVGATNLVCGANKAEYHLSGFTPARDLPETTEYLDLSKAVEGGTCPNCRKHSLKISRGIEVGNIFQLGKRYTEAMGMTYDAENGERKNPIMGCYGIGVGRLIASVCEAHHDDYGPIWPITIAPWQVEICALRIDDANVRAAADKLCSELEAAGVEVLYDDRPVSAGVMFSDADLLGAPVRVVISPKTLSRNAFELAARDKSFREDIAIDTAADAVEAKVKELIDAVNAKVPERL